MNGLEILKSYFDIILYIILWRRLILAKSIFLSIKPEYTQKIELREKLYELRNFNTKYDIEIFYIYESSPKSQLTYIAYVDTPVCYPNSISNYGPEAVRFNSGESKYKKAYPIRHLYKLKKPLKLKELKDSFGFSAPQAYVYSDTYKLLELEREIL